MDFMEKVAYYMDVIEQEEMEKQANWFARDPWEDKMMDLSLLKGKVDNNVLAAMKAKENRLRQEENWGNRMSGATLGGLLGAGLSNGALKSLEREQPVVAGIGTALGALLGGTAGYNLMPQQPMV